jgi:hypothetical protein
MAGMEMACFGLLFQLLYHPARQWPPPLVFGAFLGGVIAWMLALEGLSRLNLGAQGFQLGVLGLIVGSSVGLILFWPDGYNPLEFWLALFDVWQGLPVSLVLVLVNLLLWQRAASASSRILSFFAVGLRFRFGMIVLIIEAGLYYFFTEQNVIFLLMAYFGLGLTAVALTRIDEKTLLVQSTGPLMPNDRLRRFLALVVGTVGVTGGLAFVLSPANIRGGLGQLGPVWEQGARLFFWLLQGVIYVVEPILLGIEPFLRFIFSFLNWREPFEDFSSWFLDRPDPSLEAATTWPLWVWVSLRCVIFLAVMAMVGFLIWLFLSQVRQRYLLDENEDEAAEKRTWGQESLRRSWDWMKNVGRLVGQYGLNRQLLAAISMENMYANLSRMAAQRGYARPPAQTAEDYLPRLQQAFPAQELALQQLTESYMRVHYGDHPLSEAELKAVQGLYRQVKQTPPPSAG